MANYRRERRPDNSALWLVLGLVGGGLLVLVLVCGGLVYVLTNAFRTAAETGKEFAQQIHQMQKEQAAILEAQRTAATFLDDCLSDRVNAAYAATTPAFQKRFTLEQLKELLAQHPVGKRGPVNSVEVQQPIPGLQEYRLVVPSPMGPNVTFTVTVTRDGQALRVDQLQIDGPDAKK